MRGLERATLAETKEEIQTTAALCDNSDTLVTRSCTKSGLKFGIPPTAKSEAHALRSRAARWRRDDKVGRTIRNTSTSIYRVLRRSNRNRNALQLHAYANNKRKINQSHWPARARRAIASDESRHPPCRRLVSQGEVQFQGCGRGGSTRTRRPTFDGASLFAGNRLFLKSRGTVPSHSTANSPSILQAFYLSELQFFTSVLRLGTTLLVARPSGDVHTDILVSGTEVHKRLDTTIHLFTHSDEPQVGSSLGVEQALEIPRGIQ
ncbi:PREDICTED: uncharacterized protein LOC105564308 [Vollenhovia emeryi]|uniref:uncharacterized protein LOC105564308 n=1 Tax=Vollenhovia emeryi TaxID=411798 RepID=UPI0005F4A97F|nr:PREDICTED: uncharacterized protein LOC105564308 [Vollenhovia emeryi]